MDVPSHHRFASARRRESSVATTSYLCRRGARYHYRRRVYLRNLVSRPITIALGTADPAEARRLAACLSVRWETTSVMIQQMERGYMTASEAVAVFRHGLNDELGVAAAARYDAQAGVDHRTSRIFAATYRIAARLAAGADDLPVALLEEHTPDFSEQDRRAVILMLKSCAPHRVSGKIAHDVLRNLGAPLSDRVVGDAGVQLLLGRAEAQARMALSDHPEVVAGGDPVSALLDDTLVTRIRTAASPPARDVSEITTPFLMTDTRRLTDVVDDTIADIQASGDWNEDVAQRGRVIRGFAWITGNKRLCDYGPGDEQPPPGGPGC